MDSRNAIAIVGMACRFPGAPDVEAYWRNLRAGVESLRRFTDAELAAAGVPEHLRRDPAYVPVAGALEDADRFDAAFFAVPPREAEITDPQQRVFLECAWEALEAGGYRPGREAGRVGVFAGAGLSTYLIHNLLPRADVLSSVGDLELLMANNKDFVPTRVAYKLNLHGPAVNANTACSTGLVNVHLACQSLLAFECDMALAGGVSIQVPQEAGYLFQPDGILSPDGHCRPFDAAAAGTISGNGAGVVLLKRLDEALAARDHIHAVVLGTAINNDGSDKAGFTAPSVSGQADAVAQALAVAGVPADTIGFIEAHGTGTPVGDPIEIAALTEVFRTRTARTTFCAIGSVKSNVGHLDEAAGVAGLIKAVLAVEHGEIPPTLHFDRPNPALDLEASPFHVNAQLLPWPGQAPRRAGVSSFGLGGTNAHAVLEQAPPAAPAGPSAGWHLLPLSARSQEALDASSARLASALEVSDRPLADVAFTLLAGRTRFAHRRIVVCRDRDDAVLALRGGTPARSVDAADAAEGREVIFMFPGMGAQYPGMARDLYRAEPAFRAVVDRCSDLLAPLLDRDIRQVIFEDARGDDALTPPLEDVRFVQPALFVVEYALARLWMSWGVQPAAMIGHSAGEYVAARLAGVFSLDDALRLIVERGRVMATAGPGALLAVALDERDIVTRMNGAELDLAAVTAPGLCVVSGEQAAIERFRAALEADGIHCRDVETDVATHSRMMDAPARLLRDAAAGIALSAPDIPFISGVTATWITADETTSPDYWARHLRATVRFGAGIEFLCQHLPAACFLEVGPGRTLTSPVLRQPARHATQPVLASMRRAGEDLDDEMIVRLTMGRLWAAGVSLDSERVFEGRAGRRTPLPTYPFERQRFWIDPLATPDGPAAHGAGVKARLPAHTKRAHLDEWLYLASWRRALPPAIDSQAPGVFRRVAIVGGASLAQVCAEAVVRGGGEARVLRKPDDDRTALDRADIVLDLRACEAAGEPDAAGCFARAAALGHVLAGRIDGAPVRLVIVTCGAFDVTGMEALDPAAAVVQGAAQVIEQEHPHIRSMVVDVERHGDPARLAERLLAEAAGGGGPDRIVALRGAHRWCREYVPARPGARTPALRDRGVYVITGGTGDVGLAIGECLARACRARLVITSRARALSAAARERLEACGAEVLTRHVDVADEAAMRALFAELTSAFGSIAGVIHAAGVTDPDLVFRPIGENTREQIDALFRPKVDGTLALERALAGVPVDFCLLISSNASTLGGLGLSAYAAANHFLDAAAARQRREGRPWMASNWDGWPSRAASDSPGRTGRPGRTGIEALTMTAAQAEAALLLVLACDADRVVVSAGDLHARLERWMSEPAGQAESEDNAAALTDGGNGRAGSTEAAVLDAVHRVLGLRPASGGDSFFELGGDSLLGSRLMARLSRRFGVDLSVRLLFQDPTIAGIAARIDESSRLLAAPLTAAGEDEEEGVI